VLTWLALGPSASPFASGHKRRPRR